MGAKLLNSTQKRKKALAYCYSLCAVLTGVALLFGTLYHSNLTQDFFFFHHYSSLSSGIINFCLSEQINLQQVLFYAVSNAR